MTIKDFVIIGGGSAGISALKAIRETDSTSSIYWVTNEDRAPYKRTQINKHIHEGFEKDDFSMITHEWLMNNHIELLYDNVTHIDTTYHELKFSHRGSLRYKKLIIATGKKPRPLQIENYEDVIHHVYTARQAENIIRQVKAVSKILIIGAGIEGVETACQLKQMGKEVLLVDKHQYVLHNYFTTRFSNLLTQSIADCDIKLTTGITSVTYDPEQETFHINGQSYHFDMVISTIGYQPNIDMAKTSGIKCHKGILVNEYMETSAQDVYAAGDVAEHPNGKITGLWHAAERQGYIAGKNAAGHEMIHTLAPFRMKTEVCNELYFSVPPVKNRKYHVVKDENNGIIRELYFHRQRLEALLMKNDRDRMKLYQQALMEGWSPTKMDEFLPVSGLKVV